MVALSCCSLSRAGAVEALFPCAEEHPKGSVVKDPKVDALSQLLSSSVEHAKGQFAFTTTTGFKALGKAAVETREPPELVTVFPNALALFSGVGCGLCKLKPLEPGAGARVLREGWHERLLCDGAKASTTPAGNTAEERVITLWEAFVMSDQSHLSAWSKSYDNILMALAQLRQAFNGGALRNPRDAEELPEDPERAALISRVSPYGTIMSFEISTRGVRLRSTRGDLGRGAALPGSVCEALLHGSL